MGKRCAIVGTANSWKDTPWGDQGLEVWTLNDAYTLGFPRIDRVFEQHPLNKLHYRAKHDRVVYAEDVPHGYYVRPEGHLEWLQHAAKSIPVYLQQQPPTDWPPNAQRFPIEQAEAEFGPYWASGPSYMVALAIMEGYSEIQVYGIHLATEQEYRDQRSNFEHMLGIARGRGIKVVMAESSPVLKHGWRYGYEPKPAPHPAKVQLMKARHQKSELIQALAAMPRFASKAAAMDRLRRISATEADCLRAMSQRQRVTIEAPVYQVGA